MVVCDQVLSRQNMLYVGEARVAATIMVWKT